MKTLAIFGASGHGRVVADVALCCGWDVCFFDDVPPGKDAILGMPYGGTFNDLISRVDLCDAAFVAIGNNTVRLSRQKTLREAGFFIPTLIHPSATVSRFAMIGEGTVVMPGTVINAATRIACACIVNTGASVDHDCQLADGVHISPGAHLAGEVIVGECSWIGIGSTVRQQIRIGANVMVAAGAVVIKDIEDNITVAGVPAVRIR